MDGVLLIDKPGGLTSHDVVARIRRSSGEKRVGHTGTLDPRATGLLPLVMGRATRLASRITGGAKTYEAVIQLGIATDTDDADGRPIGEAVTVTSSASDVAAALAGFQGTFEQMPPAHSAKKVGGRKAYDLARRSQPVELAAVPVTIHDLTCSSIEGTLVSLRVTVSAGFYVRSLARDLGERLGCGAHLASLRRTGSGDFGVAQATSLDAAEREGLAIAGRLIPPSAVLPHLPAVTMTEGGLARVLHGNAIGPEHLTGHVLPPPSAGELRLMGPGGQLVALAHSRGGALHPVLVLG